MKRLRRSVAAYLTLLAFVLTWVLAETFSWYELQEISSALVMAASIIAMSQWALPAARSLRDGTEGADFFALSIFVNLFSISSQRVWINVLRWMGRPDYLVYSPVGSITALMLAYSIFLMILAKETTRGKIPIQNIFRAGTALVVGIIIAVFTMSFFADQRDENGRLQNPVSLPFIGAVGCTEQKPVRVPAFCRSARNKAAPMSIPK